MDRTRAVGEVAADSRASLMSFVPLPIAAFLAGLISFLSPCVLPLVPGYVSLISGVGVQELQRQDARLQRVVFLHAVAFVVGFGVVFVILGAVASSLGQLAAAHAALLNRIAGLLIILFGLHLAGVMPIRMLYADKHFRGSSGQGLTHAFLVGSAFAFGWTPCVGPLLAGVLALSAAEATVQKGIALLAFYSLGLAVPFLLTALGVERFLVSYRRFRHHLRKMELIGGSLLVVIGVLIFTRQLTVLNSWLNEVPLFRAIAERFL